MKKRVLHLISSLGVGGAETVLVRMVTADSRAEHIVVSLMGGGEYRDRLIKAGIEVHSLGMSRGRGGFQLSEGIRLYRLIRMVKPDILQTWMYHADLLGGIVGRIAGVRNIFWNIRSAVIKEKMPNSTRFSIQLNSVLSRFIPSRIIVNSEHACAVHSELGYSKNRMVTIPNGIPVDFFRFDPTTRIRLRHELRIADSCIALGMVARYDIFKDHQNLLSAISKLEYVTQDFVLLLIGKGMEEENEELTMLIKEYGLTNQVRLLGPTSDVPSMMSALDIHVLSSVGESFPNVVVEAMSCGVPCVATDVGDVGIVMDKTGWIVPPADPVKLADAINKAISAFSDTDQWVRRKIQVRERVLKCYSLEAMLAAFWRQWAMCNVEPLSK